MPHVSGGVIDFRDTPRRASVRLAMTTVLTLLSAAASAAGQQITIDLDPAKTKIEFVLSDVLHKVHGTFRLKAGSVELEPTANRISGTIAIAAASGDSGGGARDRRMNRDILEVQRYPEITFTPIEIAGLASSAQASQPVVTGWFAIHGQQHKILVPVHIVRSATEVSATANFVVPYVDWGMKDPSTFILHVSNKVDVSVHAVGHVRDPQAH